MLNSFCIDKELQFKKIDSGIPFYAQKLWYKSFLSVRVQDQKRFISYMLIGASNPTSSINQLFQAVLGTTQAAIINSNFGKYVYCKVLASIDTNNQLNEIFGNKIITDAEKQFFQFISELRIKTNRRRITPQQAILRIQSRYTSLKININKKISKKLALFFIENEMHKKINIRSSQQKVNILCKIHSYLLRRGQKIVEYRRVFEQQRYKIQPIIMLHRQKAKIFSLQNIIESKQEYLGQFPSPFYLAYKLYFSLIRFKEQYGKNYPALSQDNILYNFEKKEVELNVMGLVFNEMGLKEGEIYTLNDMKKTQLNFSRNFYHSQEKIKQNITNISEATLTWEFLIIIDYYQNYGNSYFSQVSYKSHILKCINRIDAIISQKKEKIFFGAFFCQVIQYFRNKGQSNWQSTQRPDFQRVEKFLNKKLQSMKHNIKAIHELAAKKNSLNNMQKPYRTLTQIFSLSFILTQDKSLQKQERKQCILLLKELLSVKQRQNSSEIEILIKELRAILLNKQYPLFYIQGQKLLSAIILLGQQFKFLRNKQIK